MSTDPFNPTILYYSVNSNITVFINRVPLRVGKPVFFKIKLINSINIKLVFTVYYLNFTVAVCVHRNLL